MKKFKTIITILLTLILICGYKEIKADIQNNQSIQTYFARQEGDLNTILINNITTANKSVYVAIYSITREDITDSLIKAKNKGIDVKIITDKTNSESKSEKIILNKLQKANIPIKVETHTGLMHLKVCIIDNSTLLTGSYNYTDSATKYNDENLLVIKDSSIINQYLDEFNLMWNDNTNYSNY